MLSLKDYSFKIDLEYYENCKDWITDVAIEAIDNVFADKPMFNLNDIAYMILDDYELGTNTCSFTPIRLYLAINQPKNIKSEENKKNWFKKKNPLIKNLHLTLDEIKDQLFKSLINILDSSCLIYNNSLSIEIWKTEEFENETKTSLHFEIIPCLQFEETGDDVIYYNKSKSIIVKEDLINTMQNFNNKNKETNNLFSEFVLIFKNLYLQQDNKKQLPALLFETILYNVPNSYFEDNSTNTLFNIINFIKNFDLKNYKTIDENDFAFTSKTTPFSIFYAKHILKTIEKNINLLTKEK